MAETYHLSVLTPERSVLEEEIVSLVAPGKLGYLGVLAHHAPLITALAPGKLTIRGQEGEERTYAIAGGFLEVSNNKAVILADAIERPEEIDVGRAGRSRDRARDRLRGSDRSIDAARAEAALHRALNRIRLASIR